MCCGGRGCRLLSSSTISSLLWLRPLRQIMRGLWRRLRRTRLFARQLRAFQDRDRCTRLVAQGRPVLIFLRRRAPVRLLVRRRRGLGARAQRQRLFARHRAPALDLRRARFRWCRSRSCAAAACGARSRGWRRWSTACGRCRARSAGSSRCCGTCAIPASAWASKYRCARSRASTTAKARSASCGGSRAPCRSSSTARNASCGGRSSCRSGRCAQRALQDEEVRAVIRTLAAAHGQAESQLWRQAERYFDEMAANFHGIYFSFLEFVFNRIWPRLFQGFEYSGLDQVLECMKRQPVVLVPCHRSHFDYVILSYIFHLNYMSPPHIAAGINLSLLAARPAVPRRRGVLHPPLVRRQRALQGGVPLLPRLPHPRGLHAGVLHRRWAQPHRQDPDPEARHAVGHRRRVRAGGAARPLSGAGLDPLRTGGRGGGVSERARRRREGARVVRQPGAGAPRPEPPASAPST